MKSRQYVCSSVQLLDQRATSAQESAREINNIEGEEEEKKSNDMWVLLKYLISV